MKLLVLILVFVPFAYSMEGITGFEIRKRSVPTVQELDGNDTQGFKSLLKKEYEEDLNAILLCVGKIGLCGTGCCCCVLGCLACLGLSALE